MPACYAHYRFGQMAADRLPTEYRRVVRNFRQLFLVGLQGPDIFFYHNPLVKDKVVKLGTVFHGQTGREFFSHACTAVNSEAAMAYLLGLLGHYCLDALTHPFVHEHTADGKISHVELESEFERFLLKSDGNSAPHIYNRGEHIHLTPGECETAAAFYPGVKPHELQWSVKRMASFQKLLAIPQPGRRRFLGKLMHIPKGQLRHHLMPERRNANCSHLNGSMLELFDQALELYPAMVAQVAAYLQNQKPFGKEFDPDFG